MQTFLPLPSYAGSLKVLDQRRLGKQRVETLQILNVLTGIRIDNVWTTKPGTQRKVPTPQSDWVRVKSNKGWGNHPMTRMWQGHEISLLRYGLISCKVWIEGGPLGPRADTCYNKMRFLFPEVSMAEINAAEYPPWFGDEAFHLSHQSNLVCKLPEYYRAFFPDVPDDLPYIWPVD